MSSPHKRTGSQVSPSALILDREIKRRRLDDHPDARDVIAHQSQGSKRAAAEGDLLNDDVGTPSKRQRTDVNRRLKEDRASTAKADTVHEPSPKNEALTHTTGSLGSEEILPASLYIHININSQDPTIFSHADALLEYVFCDATSHLWTSTVAKQRAKRNLTESLYKNEPIFHSDAAIFRHAREGFTVQTVHLTPSLTNTKGRTWRPPSS